MSVSPVASFSTKKCCRRLAMVQIYLDKFASFKCGLLGPIVWWSKVLCPGCLEPLVPLWPAPVFLGFLLAAPDNLCLAACRPTTSTGVLLLAPCIKMLNELASWRVSCIAKCLTFGKSLPCICCFVSVGLSEMAAPWGGLPALLVPLQNNTVQLSLYSRVLTLKGFLFTGRFHMHPQVVGK
jgi:hypothetical protein